MLLSVLLGCWVLISPCAYADYIILKNGNRLDGEILQETDEVVGINVTGLGSVTFNASEVDQVVREKPRRLPTRPPRIPTATPVQLIELLPEEQVDIAPVQNIYLEPTVTPLLRLNRPQREAPAPVPTPIPDRSQSQDQPRVAPPEDSSLPPEDSVPEPENPPVDLGTNRYDITDEESFSWDDTSSEGGFPEIGDFDAVQKQVLAVLGGFIIGIVFFFVLIYVYFAFCYYFIAIKTETEPAWWAWLPVLGPMLLLKVGGKPIWWVIFLYIGLIFSIIFVSMAISDLQSQDFQSQSFFEETKPQGNEVIMNIVNNVLSLVSGIFSYLMVGRSLRSKRDE